MGGQKSKKGGEKKNNEQQKKKNDNAGGKKEDSVITVVLKVDMHCEGCATKINKCVRGFEGVETVRGDLQSNKLTVIGNVDPVKLREMVEQKVRKKVELVSPQPKKDKDKDKDKDNNNNKNKDGGGGGGGEKKAAEKPQKKPDEKKPKEPPVTTAVMKVNLHCQGCVEKIRKTVAKTKGYHEISIDEQKNLVTVKGAMDMKAVAETLKKKLNRSVEIIPPKKDDGDKKEKGNGGGGGGEKKEKGGKKDKGGDAAEESGGNGGGPVEENTIQYVQYGYPNQFMVGNWSGYPVVQYHAPQMFSDENPNACSVM